MIISHKWVLFPFSFTYHEYNNKTSKDSCCLVYYSLEMTIPLYDTANTWQSPFMTNSSITRQHLTGSVWKIILIHPPKHPPHPYTSFHIKGFKCLRTHLNIRGRRKKINLFIVLCNYAFLLMEKIGKVENKRKHQSIGVNVNICIQVLRSKGSGSTLLWKVTNLALVLSWPHRHQSSGWGLGPGWSMATRRMRVLPLNGIHKFATLFSQY